jgi:hypothetical protein
MSIDEQAREPYGRLQEASMGASRDFKTETSTTGVPVPRLEPNRIKVDAVGRERPPPREGGIEKGISGSWWLPRDFHLMHWNLCHWNLPLEPLPLEPLPLPLEPQLLQPVTTYRGFTPTSEYSGSCSVELTERDSLVMWAGSPAPHEEVLNSQRKAVIKYGQVGLSCEAGPWPPRQVLKSVDLRRELGASLGASFANIREEPVDLPESNFANFRNILSMFSNVLEHSRIV